MRGIKKLMAALLCVVAISACTQSRSDYAITSISDKRLTVYTSHKEMVYGPIIKEFEESTGIWVNVVTGGSNELLELIAAQSGHSACDVMFGGGVESLSAYSEYFEPYQCGEISNIKPQLTPKGFGYTPFSSLPVVLIYNSKLVRQGEIDSWADLLDERWKGKIAYANPTVSGSGYTAAITMLSCIEGDMWNNLNRFICNLNNMVLPGSGEVTQNVADGTFWVGVTLEETALRSIAAGDEIAIAYPKEGTSAVPDGCAIISGAPHLENAKLFLEFVQSKEVQQMVVERFNRRSVRLDVGDPPNLISEQKIPLIDYNVEWAGSIKQEFIKKWIEGSKENQE